MSVKVASILLLTTLALLTITTNGKLACLHVSCIAAAPPIKKYGRVFNTRGDGFYVPETNRLAFRNILKRAGYDNDEKVVQKGRDAVSYFNKTFGVDFSWVEPAFLLAETGENLQGQKPWQVSYTTQEGAWQMDIGVMGFGANLHITSELITDIHGNTYSRVPDKDVRLAFAYWRITCNKDLCAVTGGNVKKDTKAVFDLTVTSEEAADRGWDLVYSSIAPDMFAGSNEGPVHTETTNNKIHSLKFGEGESSGKFEITKQENNKFKMRFWNTLTFHPPVQTSDLPVWASGSRRILPSIVLVITLMFTQVILRHN